MHFAANHFAAKHFASGHFLRTVSAVASSSGWRRIWLFPALPQGKKEKQIIKKIDILEEKRIEIEKEYQALSRELGDLINADKHTSALESEMARLKSEVERITRQELRLEESLRKIAIRKAEYEREMMEEEEMLLLDVL